MKAASSSVTASVVPLREARRSQAWAGWHRVSAAAPPYLSPEFFVLSEHLGDGQALLAEAHDPTGVIGALPLSVVDRTLLALRSDQTPSFDYCGTRAGLDAIWRALRADRRWDVMVLKSVPRDSLLATRLPELARRDGRPATVQPGVRHPFLPLTDFEAHLSPKFLANLRRCERKAGGIELERITAPTHADLEDALALEASAWKGAAGTALATDPGAAHLYAAMTRLFGRRGRASLNFLRFGGARVALLFAVEDDHTLHALKIGYDPQQAAVSPGHLMIWKVAADAARRGLRELDFAGKEDEWKRKWTDLVHEQVIITIYQRSLRGLATHVVRNVIKPRLPAAIRDRHSPLAHGCQRGDILGDHTLVERVRGRLVRGLGIKSGIRAALHPPRPKPPTGAPSTFAPGSWVRVKDEAALRATLDGNSRLRGLAFVPTQWETCGGVFQVQQPVRRIRDDRGVMRPVARTVLLAGVTCAGHGPGVAGCGRHCPMMYRDEWLEPAPAPRRAPPGPSVGLHARVRDADEIRAGLDLLGQRDGVTFMPEMAAYAGRRARIVEELTRVFEYDRWIAPRAPVYLLEGLGCSGAGLGDKGPCDRACALVWHRDWLTIEPVTRGEARA
ncbi:MAG: GNAT family N-acetyltransferase [Deltaproteobacteria bacterium]|nr:GNAT family N-acetyltransferase [Deltaproteobacteria bacterium]